MQKSDKFYNKKVHDKGAAFGETNIMSSIKYLAPVVNKVPNITQAASYLTREHSWTPSLSNYHPEETMHVKHGALGLDIQRTNIKASEYGEEWIGVKAHIDGVRCDKKTRNKLSQPSSNDASKSTNPSPNSTYVVQSAKH